MKVSNPIHVYTKYGCDYRLVQLEREYMTYTTNDKFSFQLRVDKLLGVMDNSGSYILPKGETLGYDDEIEYLENNPICFDEPSLDLTIKNLKTDETWTWTSDMDPTDYEDEDGVGDMLSELKQFLGKNSLDECFEFFKNIVNDSKIPSEFLKMFHERFSEGIKTELLSPLNIDPIELFDRKPKLKYISCGSIEDHFESFDAVGDLDEDGSGVENMKV